MGGAAGAAAAAGGGEDGRQGVKDRKLLGFVDRIDKAGVGGWAVDFAAPAESLQLRAVIDNVTVEVIRADLFREDARLLKLPQGKIGFYYNIPERYRDGLRHVLRFATVEGMPLTLANRQGGAMTEFHFCLPKLVRIEGNVDGMVEGLVQGWALRVDERAGTRLGGVKILVTLGGQPVAELLADQYRADVAEAVDCDAVCGFAYAPAPELRRRARSEFRFFALPERVELKGSPLEVFYPGEVERERIEALVSQVDDLFAFAYKMRKELKAALPRERYLLGDYERWAAVSAPLALARAKAKYGALPEAGPLVSVVCPVYRPEMGAFLAAMDSVRAQTYANWELLLVDDGSADEALTQALGRLAEVEKRIKLVPQKKNGGIAKATNAGLKKAKGALVAFFDHDDLLVPEALEIMVRAQRATGARLLYSDEDKVGASGGLSEPNFKPDFNHRFLLEVNYICHLVMVEAGLAKELGLDPALDGAQDHDFLLRAVEVLAPGEIHHVAEVLYHWRKAAGSTAAAGSGAKPKAVQAGEAAVAAHLRRLGREAVVESRRGLTCYQVNWRVPEVEQKVSILIPYREHVDMTAECVAAIRKHTRGVEYEIILLDNWSTSAEAEAFAAKQAALPQTRVLRIAEPFNFSRINNIGVRAARHEFVLFMNNDVFVSGANWLRRMLDEALADERVGAVGAKLLYADGTVQHAGVVLGVGGVADHGFRGIPGDSPGYIMHAMAAREVSAVTAACMLVRKAAFDTVGMFDEDELTIAFNDVDLCVKLGLAGWKVIFTPDAVAEHRESISRGDDFDEAKIPRFMRENEVMRQRYAEILPVDPFYNAHFSREGGPYRELRVITPG
jgi:GT2 family glycosyltransferase